MSSTVDRVPAAAPLVKAADHSADHNPRHQRHGTSDEDHPPPAVNAADPDADVTTSQDDDTAIVLGAHARDESTLEGIAAYQAAARHAREALARSADPEEVQADEDQSPFDPYIWFPDDNEC